MDMTTLTYLKSLQKTLSKIQKDMATKKDLKNFLTKSDAKNFATKDDLRNFPTKDDLKGEINKLKKELIQKIDDTEISIIARIDKFKADKLAISELEDRIRRIERNISS